VRKVLLTGAKGFVGRHCIPRLVAMGHEVHAVTSSGVSGGEDNGVVWHRANLLAEGEAERLARSVAATDLLHLAWCTAPGLFWRSPENRDWLYASVALIHGFLASGGNRMVGVGSCAEYDWRYGYCVESLTPIGPTTPYGKAKSSLASALELAGMASDVGAAWGRLFFLYGPGERRGRLVPDVVNALLRGQRAPCSWGGQIRDFLLAEDAADALVRLLISPVTGAVNIASGVPISIRDIVLRIATLVGQPGRVDFGAFEAPTGDPTLLVADVSRLQSEVMWRPAHTLDAGLEATIRWWADSRGI
jgi:nucleoside-diphosphate-sugar epimerase